MKSIKAVIIMCLLASSIFFNAQGETPFEKHGKLNVKGTYLVDKNNEPIQLYGMSTHGIVWFPMFINQKTFTSLRDDLNTNAIRLAMYTYENGGYCSGGSKDNCKKLINNGVSYATELGMYVIIDWHVLRDENPLKFKEEAKEFFKEMAQKYSKQGNVIYEICNEPNNCEWSDIVEYANEVIPVIRKYNKDAIILVGTPSWCQEILKPIDEPLKFNNIMYVTHFYAASHSWLRSRVQIAINSGLPVFISEFGLCTADGKGNNDFKESKEWMKLIDENKLSFFNWSLSNGDDTSCFIKRTTRKLYGWKEDELNEGGQWLYKEFKRHEL